MYLLYLLIPVLVAAAEAQVTAYFLRHAEPASNGTGLSAQGQQRAECLVNLFSYNPPLYSTVGYIVAEPPNAEGSQRSIDTITPLANSLGLTIDTSCPNDSNAGACIAGIVAEKNDDLDGGYYGDVVVVFGKDAFSGDAGAVSELHYEYGGETLDDPPVFPDVYDIIWEDEYDYGSIMTLNQSCAGIDNNQT